MSWANVLEIAQKRMSTKIGEDTLSDRHLRVIMMFETEDLARQVARALMLGELNNVNQDSHTVLD